MVSLDFFLLAMFFLQAGVSADQIRVFGTDIDIPENCIKAMNSTASGEAVYCRQKPHNYPHKHVDNYLKDLQERLSGLSLLDVNPTMGTYNEYAEEDDCESEKNKNCCSISKTDQPFIVRSNSKYKLVIQSEKFFSQQLKYTKCRDADDTTASCFKDFNFNAFNTKCITNRTPVKLFVFNDEGIESVMIEVPVACSCYATRKIIGSDLLDFDQSRGFNITT